MYIAGGWLLPGRKRVVPYSIQTLKRLKPSWFRQDLIALLDLLHQKKITPLIAQRFPLAGARAAHGCPVVASDIPALQERCAGPDRCAPAFLSRD
jgi:hypothetical protein